MRGVSKLGRPAAEWVLLGSLLGCASLVVLANDLGTRPSSASYVMLSWVFLAAAAAYWVGLYLKRPDRVDLWTVFFAFALLYFSAGGIFGLDPVLASTARVSFSVQALLLLAVGLIASRLGFLLVCRRDGAGQRKAQLCARLQTTRVSVVLLVAAAVWGLRAYAASQGQVFSHLGDVMTEADMGTSLVIQLSQLGRPLNLFLGAILLMDRRQSRRGLGLLLMLAELGFAVLWGRRQLFALIMTLLIVGLWMGRRLRLRQFVAYGSVIAFALLVMWPFMFHLRAVANRTGLSQDDFTTRTQTLVRQVIPEALATFDLQTSFEADSPYVENVRYRSQILDLLRDVMAAHRDGVPFMAGQVFMTALVAAIPRALWPGKERLLATEAWQVEELIELHFGLPIFDMASTILTHGYADGGVPGVILYMALVGVLIGVCERSLASARSRLLGLYVYALGLAFVVQVEADVTDLFTLARVIVVLLVVDWLVGRAVERWVTVRRRGARLGRPAWEA